MTERRRQAAKRLAVVLTLVCVVAGIGSANASTVNVTVSGIAASTATHPCPGTAPATTTTGNGLTYSAVSVTVPTGCVGRRLDLRMTSGATVLTGTATVAASGATVVSFAPTTYTATSAWTVTAVVDGWALPTTWSFTPPPYWCTVVTTGSTATCTAAVTIFTGTKPGGSASATYYDVVVTTSSTAFVQWEVTFSLDNAFYGTRPTRLGNSTLDGYNDGQANWTNNDVGRQSTCAAIPTLAVRGDNVQPGWFTTNDNFRDVSSARARQFSLVVNQTAAGYYDVLDSPCR